MLNLESRLSVHTEARMTECSDFAVPGTGRLQDTAVNFGVLGLGEGINITIHIFLSLTTTIST